MVEVSLRVGRLDASLAMLLTKDHRLIEFPTLLLPGDVEPGSIIRIQCERDSAAESETKAQFAAVQSQFLEAFGHRVPQTPVLRAKNVTQTSVVLEWDPIDAATATVKSLTLYKNGAKFGVIPTPLKRTATKLSGLAIDNDYTFELELSTSAGRFRSEPLQVRTHKMVDLSGITVCVGSLTDDTDFSLEELTKIAAAIGAKPIQTAVKLDTTHFICTQPDSDQYVRAQDLNIPIVRPEWLRACEDERRLVGVRAYYLNADPKLRPPVLRARAESSISARSDAEEPRGRFTEELDPVREEPREEPKEEPKKESELEQAEPGELAEAKEPKEEPELKPAEPEEPELKPVKPEEPEEAREVAESKKEPTEAEPAPGSKQEPIEEAPAVEEPIEQAPAVEEPIEQAPAVEEPIEQAPAIEEPIEQAPAAKDPIEPEPTPVSQEATAEATPESNAESKEDLEPERLENNEHGTKDLTEPKDEARDALSASAKKRLKKKLKKLKEAGVEVEASEPEFEDVKI